MWFAVGVEFEMTAVKAMMMRMSKGCWYKSGGNKEHQDWVWERALTQMLVCDEMEEDTPAVLFHTM
jgi:hypothetical protein